MYIIYSLLAALFSGLTTIFAKKSLAKIDSTLISLLRTFIILILTFVIYIIFKNSSNISIKSLFYLILSGVSTALLWIFYFKALSLADISLVTPVDKTGIIITLLLSSIFLNEKITIIKIVSSILILFGTYMMVNKDVKSNNKWFIYAILSAVFNSLITLFGKTSLKSIDSFFATFIRTLIVFIFILIVVCIKKKYKDIKYIKLSDYKYIILSGVSTTLSWIFYFTALSLGDASVVYPLEKMSAVVAIVFSNEDLTKNRIGGLVILVIGEILLIM